MFFFYNFQNADKMRTNQYFLKYKTLLIKRLTTFLVPSAGIEPAHLAVLEFESSASTNSANWARIGCANIDFFLFLKNYLSDFFQDLQANKGLQGRNILLRNQFPYGHTQGVHPQEAHLQRDDGFPCDGKYGSETFF